MTGAKDFVFDGRGVFFRLPFRFAKGGINHVRIELNALDLYTVTFGKARGINYSTVTQFDMVHTEDLQTLFTEQTGLDTHL